MQVDISIINEEGHQEGASKGYNPKKLGNRCYNRYLNNLKVSVERGYNTWKHLENTT